MLQKTPDALLYLSAAELDITELERAALIKTLVRFKARDFGPRDHVDLGVWYSSSPECGTTACVAGWAYHESDKKAFTDFVWSWRWRPRPLGLIELFHGAGIGRGVPINDVIHATETYLQSGRPDWGKWRRWVEPCFLSSE